jgi:hypothetical protein
MIKAKQIFNDEEPTDKYEFFIPVDMETESGEIISVMTSIGISTVEQLELENASYQGRINDNNFKLQAIAEI